MGIGVSSVRGVRHGDRRLVCCVGLGQVVHAHQTERDGDDQ